MQKIKVLSEARSKIPGKLALYDYNGIELVHSANRIGVLINYIRLNMCDTRNNSGR